MKKKYQVPKIEVIEIENEGGVMVASAGGIGDGGGAFGNSARRSSNTQQNASALQDIEDLINDILTY